MLSYNKIVVHIVSVILFLSVLPIHSVIIGIDGKYPATLANWKQQGYKPLEVETGTRVSFNWVGKSHGIWKTDNHRNWELCQTTSGGDSLQEPKLGGSYILETTGIKPGTVLYLFCPVHCEEMKVEIRIKPNQPCRVATDSDDCVLKPNCTWLGGKCRPFFAFF